MRTPHLVLALGLLGACRSAATSSAPHFPDLGRFHRPITTSSPDAQRFFNQGFLFCYAFNHEEAVRSFEEAARLDPNCAMAYWGIALAKGPHINNSEMTADASEAAFAAAQKAVALSGSCTPLERRLIAAVAQRYADPPPADRKPLDAAYADAMREVWRAHSDDSDVGALFAESMMDLRPWDFWTKDGKPQPGTLEILTALEHVLAIEPDHPGGLHLTIHAVEASPHPERALPAADALRDRVPGAGHLVHMPSHIDIRVGHYAEALEANLRAIEADRRYVAEVGRKGFYTMYRAHNHHFAVYAAMFEGQRGLSLKLARELLREMPPHLVDERVDSLEGFVSTPLHAMVRFGMWEEILREPAPAANRPVTKAFHHHARALALSATGKLDAAAAERELFEAACAAVPESATIGNNTARTVLAVGRPLLDGELAFRRGDFDRAFELLREAARRDDALAYDEPWGWFQPVRHSLGALLLDAGRIADAEEVYREDLARHPENGWSLHGLAECLRKRGLTSEAADAEARFKKAWANSDVVLRGSCYCRAG